MNNKRRKLAFPISDTIAGPGTYEGEVMLENLENNDEIPAVDTEESFDDFGYGTAKDITTKNPYS